MNDQNNYENFKQLNPTQKKFIEFFLAQKDAVNELMQDCILTNMKLDDLSNSNQKLTGDNKQMRINFDKLNQAYLDTKSKLQKVDHELQNSKANLDNSSKSNSDLQTKIEKLELDLAEIKSEQEKFAKEKNELIVDKTKFVEEIKRLNELVSDLNKKNETYLNTIAQLEAKLNDKDKEIEEMKFSYENQAREKKSIEAKMAESVDMWASYMKKALGCETNSNLVKEETKIGTVERSVSIPIEYMPEGSNYPLTSSSALSNLPNHAINTQLPLVSSELADNSAFNDIRITIRNISPVSAASSGKRKRSKDFEQDYDSDSNTSTSGSREKQLKRQYTVLRDFFEIDSQNFIHIYNLYNISFSNQNQDVRLFDNLLKFELKKDDLKFRKVSTQKLCPEYREKNRLNRIKSKYLSFRINDSHIPYNKMTEISVRPFEIFIKQVLTDSFKIINTAGDITAMDWLNNKYIESQNQPKPPNKFFDFTTQYFAYATKPTSEISAIQFDDYNYNDEDKLKLEKEVENCLKTEIQPNLIYICRCYGLNYKHQSIPELFSIYNAKIGTINCLKWRNDFSPLFNYKNGEFLSFLGYLLVASSNGNGYIYLVHDIINRVPKEKTEEYIILDEIEHYIPMFKIVLKRNALCGQCQSADWLQSNGATLVALGYTDGSIAVFELAQSKDLSSASRVHIINAKETIKAHNAPVRMLKWTKSNENIKLISGSTNELQVWNFENSKLTNSGKKLNRLFENNELRMNDFDMTFFNDLSACYSMDIKKADSNYLRAVNLDEDDNDHVDRSQFFTNSSITSINISDYLNKQLICDSDGNIIVLNNPKSWNQKDEMFSQLVKFITVIDKNESNKDNFRPNPMIVDFNRFRNSRLILKSPLINQYQNDFHISPVHLNKIKFNPNPPYLNWYLCAGPGFLFIHRISEIYVNSNKINDILHASN